MRAYDPVLTSQIVCEQKAVYGVEIEQVPANDPRAPNPGVPFELLASTVFGIQISKRAVPMPFYHRNNRPNEIFFSHIGCSDHDTDLGYLSNPPGTFWTMPKGIEHAAANRSDPIINLIIEAEGEITVNPDLLGN